ACGDRLMDGRASGLADDKVVAGEKLGDLAGPAADSHPAGEAVLDLASTLVEESHIFSEDDGDACIGRSVEDGLRNAPDLREFRGGEVEDIEWIDRRIRSERLEAGERR